MSGPSAPLTDVLSAREQEVLQLLATGHTVKSIAVQLGRSEASIHERLRDARRKTGVGSSRELARLLLAQKSWDRKTDLPSDRALIDAPTAPTRSGRLGTKGTIIMLLALPLGLAALALAGPPSLPGSRPLETVRASPARPSPLVGRWALDTARIPEAERPRRVTIHFSPGPDRAWTTEVEVVAPDGSASQARSTAVPDGAPVAITGTMPQIDSVALRQPAPDTLVMTLGKGGTPVSTRVYTVAKDRRTMTETIIWASGGLPALETTTFRRID